MNCQALSRVVASKRTPAAAANARLTMKAPRTHASPEARAVRQRRERRPPEGAGLPEASPLDGLTAVSDTG